MSLTITHHSDAQLAAGEIVVESAILTATAATTYAAGTIVQRGTGAKFAPFDEAPTYRGTVLASQTLTHTAAVRPVGTILAHNGTTWIPYVPGADGDPDPVAAATARGVLVTATPASGTTPTVSVLVEGFFDAAALAVVGGTYGVGDANSLRASGIVPVTAVNAADLAIGVLAADVVAAGAGDCAAAVIRGGTVRQSELALASGETVSQAILDGLAVNGIFTRSVQELSEQDNDNG